MDEIRQDVRDIKGHVIKLVEQGARHNAILEEHQKRSTTLEAIVLPLQAKVYFWEKVLKFGGAVAVGALTKWLVTRL